MITFSFRNGHFLDETDSHSSQSRHEILKRRIGAGFSPCGRLNGRGMRAIAFGGPRVGIKPRRLAVMYGLSQGFQVGISVVSGYTKTSRRPAAPISN